MYARLITTLLRLYPRTFRARWGKEWWEVADWHRRSLSGVPFRRLRLAALLLADTLLNVPRVHWAEWRDGGRRDTRGPAPGDVRHAARSLLRHPAFALAAVTSVALGIGVNTATFSVVNAVLLRPFPYGDPDRLAIVWNELPGAGMARLPLSGPQVQIIREEPDAFDDVAAMWSTSGTVTDGEGRPHQVALGRVTPNLFGVLGAEPSLGRGWTRDGPGGEAPPGVVVSDELWRSLFSADPGLVGATIDLNGVPVPVIAVMPAGFTLFFPEDGAIPPTFDVFAPLPWDLGVLPPAQHFLRVIGRLGTGVGFERASAAVQAAADRALRTYPELQVTGDRFSVHHLQEDTVQAARPVLIALLGGVGLFLLLSATNVASLILARTTARGRELAIRASLGASRAALVRLVVVEALFVALVGAAVGMGLASAGAEALWALRPPGLSRVDAVPFDPRVAAFALGISVLSAVSFSLLSLVAVRSVRPFLGERSGRGPGGIAGRRLRELLTAGEVAVGVVLVVGSALMVQSFTSLGRESIGFDPGSALTFRVSLSLSRFPEDGERTRLAEEIERRISGSPGVIGVGASSHLPFDSWANWADAAPPAGIPEADRSAYFADLRAVTPGYFPAIGARLSAGRFLDERDREGGAPAVVIDETMAERAFPGLDAVGRVLEPARFTGGDFAVTPATVVGVVEDLRDRSPSRRSGGQVFWPFAQSPRWELTFFVRAEGDPRTLSDAVRREVQAVSPDLSAARIAPMSDYVRSATALTRFLAIVGAVFSAITLVLAAVGLYGVVAFVTAQRTHEIAVRIAVGASAGETVRGVVRHGVGIAGLGVVAGAGAAVLLTRFMGGLVYGVSPHDPVTLLAVSALLLSVALLASVVPARHAARVDPVVALRDT